VGNAEASWSQSVALAVIYAAGLLAKRGDARIV